MVSLYGEMVRSMMASIKTTKNMEKGNTHLMVNNSKELGRMVSVKAKGS